MEILRTCNKYDFNNNYKCWVELPCWGMGGEGQFPLVLHHTVQCLGVDIGQTPTCYLYLNPSETDLLHNVEKTVTRSLSRFPTVAIAESREMKEGK